MKKDRTIIWEGAATDPSGYGEATRNYVLGLDRLGTKMKLNNRSFWNGRRPEFGKGIHDIVRLSNVPFTPKGNTVVFNLTPENYRIYTDADLHICLTTFETDKVPVSWLMPMRAMDLVVTYSEFNRNTFYANGITRPIKVVPHGVDTDKYRPEVEPMQSISSLGEGKFVFGSNFDWTNRKNPQALIGAYYSAFDGYDDVLLVLKVYHQFPIQKSVDTVKANIAALKKQYGGKKPPAILLITDMLDSDMMPHFYSSLDCFVLPTRGEGWGLPLSESMATGLPTIATGWGGNTEFMNNSNSYLLDFKLVEIGASEVSNQPIYAGHRWADVSVDDLAGQMKYVYEHQREARERGDRARKDMCEKWTWNMACEKLSKLLREI